MRSGSHTEPKGQALLRLLPWRRVVIDCLLSSLNDHPMAPVMAVKIIRCANCAVSFLPSLSAVSMSITGTLSGNQLFLRYRYFVATLLADQDCPDCP